MNKSSVFFDVKEIDAASRDILENAEKKFPKEVKAFLETEGKYLRRVTESKTRSTVKRRTGNLLEGIKQGKVFKNRKDGEFKNRVYGGKPAYHTNLAERGYNTKKGHVPGNHMFEDAYESFSGKFHSDVDDFIDTVMERMF